MNNTKKNKFIVAGGVAANKRIREVLTNLCEEENFEAIFPPINLCGDNAAMIAMVGLEKFKLNQFNNLDSPAKPRWPLDKRCYFFKRCWSKIIMQYCNSLTSSLRYFALNFAFIFPWTIEI